MWPEGSILAFMLSLGIGLAFVLRFLCQGLGAMWSLLVQFIRSVF